MLLCNVRDIAHKSDLWIVPSNIYESVRLNGSVISKILLFDLIHELFFQIYMRVSGYITL